MIRQVTCKHYNAAENRPLVEEENTYGWLHCFCRVSPEFSKADALPIYSRDANHSDLLPIRVGPMPICDRNRSGRSSDKTNCSPKPLPHSTSPSSPAVLATGRALAARRCCCCCMLPLLLPGGRRPVRFHASPPHRVISRHRFSIWVFGFASVPKADKRAVVCNHNCLLACRR